MKTLHAPQHLRSQYDQVMSRPVFVLQPWMFAILFLLAITLVSVTVVPIGKWVIGSFNLPVLTFNPYNHVVKVTEADGKTLTRDTGDHFYQRVEEIKKGGRYEKDYTGRLDGLP